MAPLRRWKYGPRYLCADAFICMWENEAATNSHTWCAHIHTAGLAWATVYILFIDYFLLLFFPILSHIYTSINSPFLPSIWNLSEQQLWSVWLWGCRHFVGLKNKVKAHLYHRLGRNFNFTNAPFNIAEHTHSYRVVAWWNTIRWLGKAGVFCSALLMSNWALL